MASLTAIAGTARRSPSSAKANRAAARTWPWRCVKASSSGVNAAAPPKRPKPAGGALRFGRIIAVKPFDPRRRIQIDLRTKARLIFLAFDKSPIDIGKTRIVWVGKRLRGWRWLVLSERQLGDELRCRAHLAAGRPHEPGEPLVVGDDRDGAGSAACSDHPDDHLIRLDTGRRKTHGNASP